MTEHKNSPFPEMKKKKVSFPLIILSLIILFNPTISIIDIFPDFIAFYIIAGQIKRASLFAPYFYEARSAFLKLGLIDLLKFPAFIIISMTRRADAFGYDSYAVASWSFGVIELIFLISATVNIFNALFRLGERTDANAMLSPITLGGSPMKVDTIRVFTLIFVIAKCFLFAIPDLFRLTTIDEFGSIRAVSPSYPYALLLSLIIGLIIGIFWLVVIIKYIKAIHKEGRFEDAIDSMYELDDEIRVNRDEWLNSIKRFILLLIVTPFFIIDIGFEGSDYINILPDTILSALFIIVALRLGRFTMKKYNLPMLIPSILLLIASTLFYVFETRFLYYEGYDSLINKEIPTSYLIVEILSIVTSLLIILTVIMLAISLRSFILLHTSEGTGGIQAQKYRRRLLIFNFAVMSFGIISAILKCLEVLSHPYFKTEETASLELTIIPKYEYIGLLCFIAYAIYIGLNIYFASTMRDEAIMKYQRE